MAAFVLYCAAFIGFVLAVTGRRWADRSPEQHLRKWGWVSFGISAAGFGAHLAFFFTRWAAAGRIPTSNMFEFMTFLAMMTTAAFLIIYALYRSPVLGAFAMPVGFVLLAYAAVFPQEISPLIPALQSHWLMIHVTTAAAGEAFFAVGFAAGLMYLLRVVNFKPTTSGGRAQVFFVELTIFTVLAIVGFVGTVFTFKGAGYEAVFLQEKSSVDQKGQLTTTEETVTYTMPPIVKPYNSEMVRMTPFLGMKEPLFETPSWMNGVNAGRKLNTVVWSLLTAAIMYAGLRLILRKPIGAAIQPALDGMDPEDLDEISYRAIAIGFPVFSLGGLVFAMIWAHKAWGRFWGWDPKETWAFITWLFYTIYLHLRLSRGWLGRRSAWMAVIGFVVVMFTLVGVNLVIAGLHSYAGV